MSLRFPQLKSKEQRGSKPRCHLLTQGPREVVAARLTALATPFATLSAADSWMPAGFEDVEEAQLDKAPRLLPAALRQHLAEWWLPAGRLNARTPNFDIASTCTNGGRPGLLLVEAKAHVAELVNEAGGRRVGVDDSDDRKASHETIRAAIDSACSSLCASTQLDWRISRDSHYQISNRFAWAWKLAEQGVPVVLVYLGFLNAADMSKPGEQPFADGAAWESLVRAQSAALVPANCWGQRITVNGVPLIPLIRSLEVPLGPEARS